MRHKTTTSTAKLEKAFAKALKNVRGDNCCVASMVDAGFVFPESEAKTNPGRGYQIFVKACVYLDELRKEQPDTGGLMEYDRPAPEKAYERACRAFGTAAVVLENALRIYENNAPINAKEGNVKQARHERKAAREIRRALETLGGCRHGQ